LSTRLKGRLSSAAEDVSASRFLNFDVYLYENLHIPPQSECIISTRVALSDNKEGVFYPYKLKLAKFGVVAAQSLSLCSDGWIPVKLINVNSTAVTLYKNTKIGEFEILSHKKLTKYMINSINKKKDNNTTLRQLLEKIHVYENLSNEHKDKAFQLIKKYEEIFSIEKTDVGFCKFVKHEIELKQNAPVQQINGTVPLHVENWVDEQVDHLKKMGVIRDSNSPWSAPVVVVKKKNGEYRMCIDFRRLNSVTVKPIYKIPDSQSLFNHLSGAKMFSSIDVSSAYYQCEMREEDKKLTAFNTRRGQFEFNRMPFGLSGAPFTFQRLMHTILREENWLSCLVYLDDILIFSKDFEEHLERVEVIFEKIKQSGLKLSPTKCKFFMPEVTFLGHVVSKNGLQTDPSKISALKDWPLPSSVSQMRQFLGFVNYYRKFVRSFAQYTILLEEILTVSCKNITKKNDMTALLWNKEGKEAFEKIKDVLCTAPCLSFPEKDSVFILDTDASHSAIGCVLSQLKEGGESVIAYGSRKLTKAEKSYCITRKELLAVYYFVTQYKQFLLGKKFIIRTDHKALKWLLNWDSPNTSQYCSWVAELEIYDFEIQHRPGEKHTNADFFSRPFSACGQCEINHENPKARRNVKIYAMNKDNDHHEVIKKVHSTLGHVGVDKMVSYLKETGNFSTEIMKVVQEVVGGCTLCAQRKVIHVSNENRKFTSPNLFHSINLDVAGPLPLTKSKNRFLLSIIDVYSRYICLFPIKDLYTTTICTILEKNWFPAFGFPEKIITDGGSYFTSHEMSVFLAQFGIRQHISSPYHSQSNGLVERSFFTVKDMIFACCGEKGKEWDEVLHLVETGLRSTRHNGTGHTPFNILYGFTPKLSKWFMARNMSDTQKRRDTVRAEIDNRNKEIEAQNNRINSKFYPGDNVMIRVSEQKPGVYAKRFIGPGKIIRKRANKSYVVKIGDKTYVRHEDHVKLTKLNAVSSHATSIHSAYQQQTTQVRDHASHTQFDRYPKRNRHHTQRYGYDL